MKAHVDSWKLWNAKDEYPVLILEASKEEVKETEALRKLDEICKGLRGLGYKQKLAAINNPDTKYQKTSFVIDLGTLLTLSAEIQFNEAKKVFATNWLQSLAKSHMTRIDDKVPEELMCRCGRVFKTVKLRKKHIKTCSRLKLEIKLLKRVAASLKQLKGKANNGNKAEKTSKLRNTKSNAVQAKNAVRSKKKSHR